MKISNSTKKYTIQVNNMLLSSLTEGMLIIRCSYPLNVYFIAHITLQFEPAVKTFALQTQKQVSISISGAEVLTVD